MEWNGGMWWNGGVVSVCDKKEYAGVSILWYML